MHVLVEQVLRDVVPVHHGLEHGKNVGILLQLDRERGSRRVQPAGGQVESLVGTLEVGPRETQDKVVLPFHQVGKEQVELLVLDDGGMDAEERLGMGSHVHALGKVVGLFLGALPELVHFRLALVDVVRKARLVVENLGQAAQSLVGLRVLCAHDEVTGLVHRGLEGHARTLDGEVAQPLIRGADPVVRLRGGAEPALADVPPLPDAVLGLLQAQAAARRKEVPSPPRPAPASGSRSPRREPSPQFLLSPSSSSPRFLRTLPTGIFHDQRLHPCAGPFQPGSRALPKAARRSPRGLPRHELGKEPAPYGEIP